MPHQVSVYYPTLSTDTSGGTNEDWTTPAATGVPCQIMFGEGGESNEYSQSQFQRNVNTIAFNEEWWDVLTRGERLTDDRTGDKYRVTGISKKQGIGGIPDFIIVGVTQVR